MCVYSTHAHTLQMGYLMWAGTTHLEIPKNSDGLNLGTYTRMCVQSTHVYIYAGRRDEIWTKYFIFKTYFLDSQSRVQNYLLSSMQSSSSSHESLSLKETVLNYGSPVTAGRTEFSPKRTWYIKWIYKPRGQLNQSEATKVRQDARCRDGTLKEPRRKPDVLQC